MELTLKDAQSALEVSEATFGREFNEALVHQVVVAFGAGARLVVSYQSVGDIFHLKDVDIAVDA